MFYQDEMVEALRFGDVVKGFISAATQIDNLLFDSAEPEYSISIAFHSARAKRIWRSAMPQIESVLGKAIREAYADRGQREMKIKVEFICYMLRSKELENYCSVCGGLLTADAPSWTVRYSDGDTYYFHQKCIGEKGQEFLLHLLETAMKE